MIIELSPTRAEAPLTASKTGDTLSLNGVIVDLSTVTDTVSGEDLGSDWIVSAARIDGDLTVVLRLPHGPDAPPESRFPDPITVLGDGPLPLPPYDAPDT